MLFFVAINSFPSSSESREFLQRKKKWYKEQTALQIRNFSSLSIECLFVIIHKLKILIAFSFSFFLFIYIFEDSDFNFCWERKFKEKKNEEVKTKSILRVRKLREIKRFTNKNDIYFKKVHSWH